MSPVFLSYARLDNEGGAQRGWVGYFYTHLLLMLKPKLGKHLDFWRDVEEVEKGAEWHDPIKKALEEARVLLSIMSPAYFNSTNCCFELNHFLDSRTPQKPLGTAETVIKVLKEQINATHVPPSIREPEAYQFYINDNIRGNLAYYNSAIGLREDLKWVFFVELERLANRLVSLLKVSEDKEGGCGEPSGPTVYVAVPSPGSVLERTYSELVAELTRRGVKVVPDRKRIYAELDTLDRLVLEQAVTNSILAIHLLDPTAGTEAAARDLEQLEATRKRAELPAVRLQRMLWLARKERPTDVDNELAASVRRNQATGGRLLERDTLFEGDYEKFIVQVRRKLFPNEEPAISSLAPASDTRRTLFLLVPPGELAAARDVAIPHLKNKFRCYLPLSADADTDARTRQEARRLKEVDSAAIYWGAAGEGWVDEQLARIEDWAAVGRSSAFADRLVVLGPPASRGKEEFYNGDVELLELHRGAK